MTVPDVELEALRAELAQARLRLKRVEDERAVLDTLYAYHHCLGSHDRAGFLNCFDGDGVLKATRPDDSLIYEIRGRDALGAWYDKRARAWPAGSESHAYVSPRVRVEGDGAEATGFFITMSMGGGALVLRSTGQYSDRLVRSGDGAWRIRERRTQIRMTNRQSFVS